MPSEILSLARLQHCPRQCHRVVTKCPSSWVAFLIQTTPTTSHFPYLLKEIDKIIILKCSWVDERNFSLLFKLNYQNNLKKVISDKKKFLG